MLPMCFWRKAYIRCKLPLLAPTTAAAFAASLQYFAVPATCSLRGTLSAVGADALCCPVQCAPLLIPAMCVLLCCTATCSAAGFTHHRPGPTCQCRAGPCTPTATALLTALLAQLLLQQLLLRHQAEPWHHPLPPLPPTALPRTGPYTSSAWPELSA